MNQHEDQQRALQASNLRQLAKDMFDRRLVMDRDYPTNTPVLREVVMGFSALANALAMDLETMTK